MKVTCSRLFYYLFVLFSLLYRSLKQRQLSRKQIYRLRRVKGAFQSKYISLSVTLLCGDDQS